MLAWNVHEREDKPEMADVLKKIVGPQKLAQKRPKGYKHDSMHQVFANPSKEEVTYPLIYPLSVKEIVEIQC